MIRLNIMTYTKIQETFNNSLKISNSAKFLRCHFLSHQGGVASKKMSLLHLKRVYFLTIYQTKIQQIKFIGAVPNVEFDLMLGFWHLCTEIENQTTKFKRRVLIIACKWDVSKTHSMFGTHVLHQIHHSRNRRLVLSVISVHKGKKIVSILSVMIF